MNSQPNLRILTPLQFELLSERDEMYDNVLALRDAATSKFEKVSKVFRLFDEACKPVSTDDMLMDVKLQAQGLILKLNRVVSVVPRSVVGFSYLLPNGKIGQMALATYPDVVKLRDGMNLEVPCRGKAAWCGLIKTLKRDCPHETEVCDKCVQSHELACELLDVAERRGIVTEVYDATDFWFTRNLDSLRAASAWAKRDTGCDSHLGA